MTLVTTLLGALVRFREGSGRVVAVSCGSSGTVFLTVASDTGEIAPKAKHQLGQLRCLHVDSCVLVKDAI